MAYLFLVPALEEEHKPSDSAPVGPPGLYFIISLFQQHLEICLELQRDAADGPTVLLD